MKPNGQTGRQKPLILRGSLFLHRRRCGRPNCHCATGSLHESWVLSIKRDGRTEFIGVKEERLGQVKTACERYRRAAEVLNGRVRESIERLRAQNRRK